MTLTLHAHLDYALAGEVDVLLLIEAAALPDQIVSDVDLDISSRAHFSRVPAEDGVGERIWVRAADRLTLDYRAAVAIERAPVDLSALAQPRPHRLPGETVKYLLASRYCESDEFQSFAEAEFGGLSGGARVAAMSDWIKRSFTYMPGSSDARTTARDSFVLRQGVCRDYAHMLITLARASTIPARMVSVYAAGVEPPDFHAVAEVWLEDEWRLVDPSGMARTDELARIGVGRDAADIAFMTTYGRADLKAQSVSVQATPRAPG